MAEESRPKLKPAENQVAGHTVVGGKVAAYTDDQGRFYKALQPGVRAERELKFYEDLKSLVETLPEDASERTKAQQDGLGLSKWVPHYYGRETIDEQLFVVMENLVGGYTKACLMDAKIGYTTCYDWADDKYKAKVAVKDVESTGPVLGYRICGLQVYQQATGEIVKPDRAWAKGLKPESIGEAFSLFANNGSLSPSDVYGGEHGALVQLKQLSEFFHNQTSYVFFAASVIISYEGAAKTAEEAKVRVRLVDFAHTFPSPENQKDANFSGGLDSLIESIEKCL